MAPKKGPDTFNQVKSVLDGAFEFFGKYTERRQEDAKNIAQGLGEKPKAQKRREKRESIKRDRVLYSQTHELGETNIKEKMPDYKKSVLFVGTSDKGKWLERVFDNHERSAKFIKTAEKFISLNDKIVIDIAGMNGSVRDERIKQLKEIVDFVRILKGSPLKAGDALKVLAQKYGEEVFNGQNGVLNLLTSFERATGYENFKMKENDYIILKLGDKKGKNYRVTGLLKKDATVAEVKQRANQPNESVLTGFEKVQFELMKKIEDGMTEIAVANDLLLDHNKRSSIITDVDENPIVKVFINNEGKYQIGYGVKKFISDNPNDVIAKVMAIVEEDRKSETLKESKKWYKETRSYLTSAEITSRLPKDVKISASESSKMVVIGNVQFQTDYIVSSAGKNYYGKLDKDTNSLILQSSILTVVDGKEKIRIFKHTIKIDRKNPKAMVDEFVKIPVLEDAFERNVKVEKPTTNFLANPKRLEIME